MVDVMSHRWVFAGELDQVRRARETIADFLPTERIDRDDALLTAGELAANAVRHSRSAGWKFELELTITDTHVEIAVHDAGSDDTPQLQAQPDMLAYLDDSADAAPCEQGRGLWLVAAHAHAWGHEARDDGTTVWACFRMTPAAVMDLDVGSDLA